MDKPLYKEEPRDTLEPMWTAVQAAKYFNVHRYTIYRWIKEGKMKAYYINTRFRIPRSEIERIANGIKNTLMPS